MLRDGEKRKQVSIREACLRMRLCSSDCDLPRRWSRRRELKLCGQRRRSTRAGLLGGGGHSDPHTATCVFFNPVPLVPPHTHIDMQALYSQQ